MIAHCDLYEVSRLVGSLFWSEWCGLTKTCGIVVEQVLIHLLHYFWFHLNKIGKDHEEHKKPSSNVFPTFVLRWKGEKKNAEKIISNCLEQVQFDSARFHWLAQRKWHWN